MSTHSSNKLFGRHNSLHELLGGGRAADVFLWRDTRLSGGILLAVTVIWLLFEVMEYNFITLSCHISITLMLVIFIWSNIVDLLRLEVPKRPEFHLERRAREAAIILNNNLSRLMLKLHDIASGKDLKLFLLAIASLWMISVIGSSCSSITLVYFGAVFLFTVPVLYERYEHEVDHFASKGRRDMKKMYEKFDTKFLDKIPRGPVKKDRKSK